MSKTNRESLKRKHWSIKAHESLISRNPEGNFCLNVEGGAENGLFPYIGVLRQERIQYQSGKLHHGELVLEVNHKRVPGMIKKDVIALIKRSADPVSILTTKQNATITKDIRQYLATRFTKNSVDSELQHQIRENLHMRVVPCTTRKPQDKERHGVDYNFITVEEFKRMEKNGELLEYGVYEGNYYGTPKPPPDMPSSSSIPHYTRSPATAGYNREGLVPAESLSPSRNLNRGSAASGYTPSNLIPKNLGPLPPNWEIAYTENNEKYFIDHNTGTTHWLDPRLARYLKHSMLECTENELPYGWEKVNDPVYGTYFIDHVNRITQYENPVSETKRKFAGAQLINMRPAPAYDDRAPPPLKAPPSFQSTAALEKQREAEAAVRWPDAGLRGDYTDSYPYPYPSQQMPTEHDLESELMGEVMKVNLRKTTSGFGFTIIGGDRAGELLQIKSIVRGSVADRDGRLQVGDVLVRINGISVLTYNHKKVVDLFQTLPLNSDVIIEIRRGYPLPEFQGGPGEELPSYNESNRSMGYGEPMQNSTPVGHGAPLPTQTGYEPALPPQPEKLTVNIVKGPLGFGFSLGESTMGPVVKQIMDHPRCAQLREGDILLEVNNEKVRNYLHSDLVTVLKRCNKGNQAAFSVLRAPPPQQEYYPPHHDGFFQEQPPRYPGPDGYLSPGLAHQLSNEPFSILEIRLMRQVSGFGFRIIGGKEEGSQATVGAIVAGGAADLDGRLLVGDEITHINNRSVMDASHRDVISFMGEAAAQGEVVLGIRRKMPMAESVPPPQGSQSLPLQNSQPPIPQGVRDVIVERPDMQTSFGFVLQSNTLRSGCMICRLIPESPAELCGQLYIYDELLAVNGTDVSQVDHSDIVTLIKSSGTTIHLTVQQPEDLEAQERNHLDMAEQSMHSSLPPMDRSGRVYPSPMAQGYPDDNRRQYQDYPNPGGYQYEEEVGPQISADLDDIASEDEEIHHIDIHRDGAGFGFSIRGGAEYTAPLCVLRIAGGGVAENDGRLRVGDELLEINGNSTEGMLHSDAITIIKHGGNVVKLIVRRVPDDHEPPFGSAGSFPGPRSTGSAPGLADQTTPTPASPAATSTKDRYAQEYMNSLQRSKRSSSREGPMSPVSPSNQ